MLTPPFDVANNWMTEYPDAHVIPTDDMSQLSFENAAATVDPGDLSRAAAAIIQHLD